MTVILSKPTRVHTKLVEFVEWAAVDQARQVARRTAKAARMQALARHIRVAIDRGLVADRAAVTRKPGFTGQVTQLLDLTLLAPVLNLEAVDDVEPSSERWLRVVLKTCSKWRTQPHAYQHVRPTKGSLVLQIPFVNRARLADAFDSTAAPNCHYGLLH